MPVLNVCKRKRVGFKSNQKSRTKQEFKQDCDINVLLKRFTQSGSVLPVARPPVYGDATIYPESFQDAMQIVAATNEAFDALPSDLRVAFQNDPRQYLSALQSEEGREFIRQHGLDLADDFFEDGSIIRPPQPSALPLNASNPPAEPLQPPVAAAPKEGA